MTKTMNLGVAALAVAALTFAVFAVMPSSALACGGFCGGSNDTNINNGVSIEVENSGSISSFTTSYSSTGGNWAGGSTGGDGEEGGNGGNGGDAGNRDRKGCGCEDLGGDANGGNGGNGGEGGNGGAGGPGGLVDTGDAKANSGSMNVLNSTDISVEAADCGCASGYSHSGWGRRGDTDINNKVKVEVENEGSIASDTSAKAKTGHNNADGSVGGNGEEGGNGGNGGDAQGSTGFWDGGSYFGSVANGGDGGDAGNGGNGADGGVGGTIRTGRAESNSGSINVMNSTIVRVTR